MFCRQCISITKRRETTSEDDDGTCSVDNANDKERNKVSSEDDDGTCSVDNANDKERNKVSSEDDDGTCSVDDIENNETRETTSDETSSVQDNVSNKTDNDLLFDEIFPVRKRKLEANIRNDYSKIQRIYTMVWCYNTICLGYRK